MIINSDKEMEFLHNSILLANGVHAAADAKARKCGNAQIHAIGLSLELRAREALRLSHRTVELPDGLI